MPSDLVRRHFRFHAIRGLLIRRLLRIARDRRYFGEMRLYAFRAPHAVHRKARCIHHLCRNIPSLNARETSLRYVMADMMEKVDGVFGVPRRVGSSL